MSSPNPNRIARYIFATFDAAQDALRAGKTDEFNELAAQHRGLVDFHNHLVCGGLVN